MYVFHRFIFKLEIDFHTYTDGSRIEAVKSRQTNVPSFFLSFYKTFSV